MKTIDTIPLAWQHRTLKAGGQHVFEMDFMANFDKLALHPFLLALHPFHPIQKERMQSQFVKSGLLLICKTK